MPGFATRYYKRNYSHRCYNERETPMKKIIAAAGFIILASISQTASADVRPYTWAYGYMTPAKGERELEWWGELQRRDDGSSVIIPAVEAEYGITDRWVAGLYAVGLKDGSEDWKLREIKLEQRYRLFDQGRLPVDTALYLEYKHDFSERVDEVEGKVIFSKDAGGFNAVLNLSVEKALETSDPEYGYSFGISYPVSARFTPAVEAFGGWKGTEREHYVGPSVLVRLGKVWINAGAGIGISKGSDDFKARLVVSHEF